MQSKLVSARVIHGLGALIGVALIGVAVWGDYEADSYGFQRRASTPLRGLSCPILITGGTGAITLNLSNPTDTTLHPSVRMEISAVFKPEVFVQSVDLGPGETKNLEWVVGPANIDLGYFILANAQVYATYPIPNRETTCGILVLDLPVNGHVLTVVSVLLSLLGMGSGLFLLSKQAGSAHPARRVVQTFRLTVFLTLVITAGLYVGFIGLWLPGTAALVIIVLTMLVNISVPSSKGE